MQPEEPQKDPKQGINWILRVLNGLTACVTVFIRNRWGVNGLYSGWLAPVIMYFWCAFYPCEEMLIYGLSWGAVAVFRRLTALGNHSFGVREISTFEGNSICGFLTPFSDPHKVRLYVEPPLTFLAAYLMSGLSSGLSDFLVLCSIAMLIKQILIVGVLRTQDIRDWDARAMMGQRMARIKRRN